MKKISVLGRLNWTFFASPRPLRITWTVQYLLWVMLPVHNFQYIDTLRGVHWPKVCFCVDRNWVKLVSITRSSIQLSLHSEKERFPQFKEEQRKRKNFPLLSFLNSNWILGQRDCQVFPHITTICKSFWGIKNNWQCDTINL